MRTFILVLGLWTFCEGALSFIFPGLVKKVFRVFSRDLAAWIEAQPDRDLRKLALLEWGFGCWMLALWLWTG